MIETSVLATELKALMTSGNVNCDPKTLGEFSSDAGVLSSELPLCVVEPATTEEMSNIMRYAYEKNIPIFPAGAQTGLSGGAVPSIAGISLSLAKMNRILEISPEDRYAIVESGVITAELDEAVKPFGLTYPVDPASRKWSTIGGNIANNAGGLSSVKYGVTRDYVKGLEVVLPDGTLIRTGAKTIKSVVGYDLTRLFVGSEGTLGIVTKAILRLTPRPQNIQGILVILDDLKYTVELVVTIFRAGLTPRILELMDQKCLIMMKDYLPIDWSENISGALLIECDGYKSQVDSEIEEIISIIQQEKEHVLYLKNYEEDHPEYQKIYEGRSLLGPLLSKECGTVICEDFTTPPSQTWRFLEYMYSLTSDRGIEVAVFGHIGDGNLHIALLHTEKKNEEVILKTVEDLVRYCLVLGGTISGEHGIGLSKAHLLPLELTPSEIALMQAIKKSLDPKGLLNPYKIFG